jgi:hypothetical protein
MYFNAVQGRFLNELTTQQLTQATTPSPSKGGDYALILFNTFMLVLGCSLCANYNALHTTPPQQDSEMLYCLFTGLALWLSHTTKRCCFLSQYLCSHNLRC